MLQQSRGHKLPDLIQNHWQGQKEAAQKIFLPVSAAFFTAGLGWYAYTLTSMGRFTNMSMLLLSAAVIVFLIGLISEQITALTYSKT